MTNATAPVTGTPRVPLETVRAGAIEAGVCVRPIIRQMVDTETGESTLVPIPCQATLASLCPPCAERARKLRMQQCREGWHLDTEPESKPREVRQDEDQDDELDGDEASRKQRSTRRRDDVPDLPRLPIEARTVGRTFQASDGKVWRPSMFLTCTMPSYGRVGDDGAPIDPARYNYRRAALDALHFSKLWDRFVQNMRRAVGYQVQYFAAIEPQRRLAPHIHAAIRGTIPRKLMRQVVAATYASVWWPSHEQIRYPHDRMPVWNDQAEGYYDATTGERLPTWDEALAELDRPDARPAHVLRFGSQTDMQGLIAGTVDADRRIGYLAKYLTKAIADPLEDDATSSRAREAHVDRLHREVRWLPCSPKCWNWLAYGVQPDGAESGMVPGSCPNKAHDREHLGVGGRRVLVSRKWTGKTLTDHKADRYNAVRTVLEAAGIELDEADRCSVTALRDDGRPRFIWETVELEDTPTYAHVLSKSIAERNRWRRQYEDAKQQTGPPFSNSATGPIANAHGRK
jgi:hypothetical protein